jgi:hypothetical protein
VPSFWRGLVNCSKFEQGVANDLNCRSTRLAAVLDKGKRAWQRRFQGPDHDMGDGFGDCHVGHYRHAKTSCNRLLRSFDDAHMHRLTRQRQLLRQPLHDQRVDGAMLMFEQQRLPGKVVRRDLVGDVTSPDHTTAPGEPRSQSWTAIGTESA